jgi:ubiquinone/menaquinone biosynthesis C-methylase UbiE
MDFHDSKNRRSYTSREADDSWLQLIGGVFSFHGMKAADIGCGGGIYTKALVRLGAAEVTGVDFSEVMIEGAASYCAGLSNVRFQRGHALQTGFPDASFDVVLARALIHHLSGGQLAGCFKEAGRTLRQGGTLIVQDRTPDDCLLAGGKQHLRGYFFERFPQLIEKETVRRHTSAAVCEALADAGFVHQEQHMLWETRKKYASFLDFCNDLRHRTGRSLLHELSDPELEALVDYIQLQSGYRDEDSIEEKDRWTVWAARKH